jgi:hypothetical protein
VTGPPEERIINAAYFRNRLGHKNWMTMFYVARTGNDATSGLGLSVSKEIGRRTPDVIADWGDGHDLIDLSGIDARVIGDLASSWVGSSAFGGHAGNVNTDKAADFQIQTNARPGLAALDFVL